MLTAKKSLVSRWMVALALTVGLGLGSASAETVRLNTDARLRARPGERAPTIVKLDEGKAVKIVGKQGRWLKVQVGGRTGWITRTQVDMEEATETRAQARETPSRARKTGKAKARKGWSNLDEEEATGADAVDDEEEEFEDEEEAPVAKKAAVKKAAKKIAARPKKKAKKSGVGVGDMIVVKKDAPVRQRPSGKADELYTAEKGEEMKVILADEDGNWVRVQHEDGTKGWIETKLIASADDFSDEEEADEEDVEMSEESDDEDGEPSVRKRRRGKKAEAGKLWYSLGANVGFLSKKQDFTSASSTFIGKYALANNTPAVLVGALVGKRFGKYEAIAEGWYMQTVAGNGVEIKMDAMAMAETLDWSAQAIDVRAGIGYHLDADDKYTLYARAGYHAYATTVSENMNAKLPSESLKGFTAGAMLDAPMVTPKIGVRVSFEALLGGTLEQTEGYRDGESSTVAGYYLGAMATYRVSPKLDGLATYNLAYEGVAFAGASEREAAAINGTRKDMQHILGVGIRYQF